MGKTDMSSDDTSTNGPKTNPGTMSSGQITVHIELNEVRVLDDGTPVPVSPVMKATEVSKDVEDMEMSMDDRDDPVSRRLDNMRRTQIGRAMELRQDAIERKQERKDFKRQI